jgi:hypothetical protein
LIRHLETPAYSYVGFLRACGLRYYFERKIRVVSFAFNLVFRRVIELLFYFFSGPAILGIMVWGKLAMRNVEEEKNRINERNPEMCFKKVRKSKNTN